MGSRLGCPDDNIVSKRPIVTSTRSRNQSVHNYYSLDFLPEHLEAIETELFSDSLDEEKKKFCGRFFRETIGQEKRIFFHDKLKIALKKHNLNVEMVARQKKLTEDEKKDRQKRVVDDVLYAKDWDEYAYKIGLDIKHKLAMDRDAFMKKFEDFVHANTNPQALYNYYFKLPEQDLTTEDLQASNSNLPLFLRWNIDSLSLLGLSTDTIKDIMNHLIKDLRNSGLVVRLILGTLQNKDKKEDYSFFDKMTQIAASATTSYGLNHGALQIGPYYIHFTTLSIVTFHDVEQKGCSFAMIYPNQDFSLQYNKPEQLLELCKAIVDFNSRQYDDRKNNCHHFVEGALAAIKCPPFPENGPIANFLDLVRWSNTGVNHMRIKDLDGKLVEFDSYETFKKYCQKVIYIHTSPSEITDAQQQFLQVLRAVERGFQIQLPLHKQILKKDLVFPGSEESSLCLITDKITKFN